MYLHGQGFLSCFTGSGGGGGGGGVASVVGDASPDAGGA